MRFGPERFSCAYCCNGRPGKLHTGQQFVRRRTPGNVVKEVLSAQRTVAVEFMSFQDDVFTLERDWVIEFAGSYKKHIGIPFWCYTHALDTDFGTLELLRDA